MSENPRECWQNCYWPDDEVFLNDRERIALDSMEDGLGGAGENGCGYTGSDRGF